MHRNNKEATIDVGIGSLSAVAGDVKRAAIVVHLLDEGTAEKAPKLKADVEKMLGRRISYGSFGWHLAQLRASDILEMDDLGKYHLTMSGADVAKIVRQPLMSSLKK